MSTNTTIARRGRQVARDDAANLTIKAWPSVPQCGKLPVEWVGYAPPFKFYMLDANQTDLGLQTTLKAPNGTVMLTVKLPPQVIYIAVEDNLHTRVTSKPVAILRGHDKCTTGLTLGHKLGTMGGVVGALFVIALVLLLRRRRSQGRLARSYVRKREPETLRLNDLVPEDTVALIRAAARPARRPPPSASPLPLTPMELPPSLSPPLRPPPVRRETGEPDPDDVAPPYSPANATKYPPLTHLVVGGEGSHHGGAAAAEGRDSTEEVHLNPISPPPPLTPLSPRPTM
ncbi:uncharacterized protein LOC62_01G000668 [Vanrija pseudolonga]|uniref:Uncharacterized protein n=1 Tax=Vanrija pseudolonga TaxID=143232 RepID=A0AAF0Y0R8_9TREE|nr:hypothetical protein LOC62_01G000668 [Vanrija pseudolonga]